jgi:hypothetical protein
MTKQANDHTGWYANTFKAWQAKVVGPKPTAEMLATVHGLGLRPGKQALANAMALRDCGVTGPQIVFVCGAPQLNRMRGLITDGHVKREAVPPNELGHAVYKITLTPKGAKRVKGQAAAADKGEAEPAADKPAKAKRTSKPRKAKVRVTVGDVTGPAVPANVERQASEPAPADAVTEVNA